MRTVYRRLARGRAAIQHESHWAGKNGTRRLISWNSAAIADGAGHPRHLVRIGTDITERREIETALQASETALRQSEGQLQALATGLITAQEEERAHVARELHDDISQKLAALNLEADKALQAEPRDDGKLRDEMTRLVPPPARDSARRRANRLPVASLLSRSSGVVGGAEVVLRGFRQAEWHCRALLRSGTCRAPFRLAWG